MSETVIEVEDLGKLYRLGEIGTGTLGQDFNRWWARVRGKEDPFSKIGEVNDRTTKGKSEYVWALNDIKFDVKQGEVLGIIGRNGAGKSTLLKLLSKVTSPSKGHIKIQGRIASLLEVGTGFHPELTGRENIFLNGAILGMSKAEIKKKFDEILDFAGVERYVDTPVKRYSSGMYVRLAFAVAAHLESEILIIDEVLAVGDSEFQKKCLGKMGEVSKGEGRTVLFVSHNMGSINTLCSRALVLSKGNIIFNGKTEEGIYHYLESVNNSSKLSALSINDAGLVNYISSIVNVDEEERPRNEYGSNENINLKVEISINEYHPSVELALSLLDKRKNRVFTIHEKLFGVYMATNERYKKIKVQIPQGFLAPGKYSWLAGIHIPHQQQFHLLENVCDFQIVNVGSEFSNYDSVDVGVVMPKYKLLF
ncbi:MAG TPA: ABC transporter ATP-binding protein [Segetibacter sp.]|jgi:lipopolysaccharide transport system ATP-binding protein